MSNPTHAPEALAAKPVHKWDDGDAASLRNYLDKNPRFLAALASRTPPIETTNFQVAALTGATHAGYEALFRAISSLASDGQGELKSPFITPDEDEA